jgi:hypothetical protein
MRRNWLLRGIKFAVFAVIAVAVIGGVVMALWNWLMPALFGWPTLGFAQALGLFVLSKLLLGGLRGGYGGRGRWRARMIERWEQMSDEEREKFRAGMGRRCARTPPAA